MPPWLCRLDSASCRFSQPTGRCLLCYLPSWAWAKSPTMWWPSYSVGTTLRFRAPSCSQPCERPGRRETLSVRLHRPQTWTRVWWRALRLWGTLCLSQQDRGSQRGMGYTGAESHSREQGARDRRFWAGRQQGYEVVVWAIKVEGWWSRKGLSGVDVAYIEEGKAPARWQDSVPPGQICFGLSLSPHPEHMSSARDSCASLITVLL